MKRFMFSTGLVAMSLSLTGVANASYLDLSATTAGVGSFSGGGQVTGYFDTAIAKQSVGSGVIDSFVRVSSGSQTTVEGYNTSTRPLQNDENTSPTFTKDVRLADFLTFNCPFDPRCPTGASGTYIRFVLDINQNTGGDENFLILDDVRLYTSAAPLTATLGSPFPTTGATEVWNLQTATQTLAGCNVISGSAACVSSFTGTGGATITNQPTFNGVLLNYDNARGSGNSYDMLFWLPTSIFGGGNPYLTLYSKFGLEEDSKVQEMWGNNDGYEEWAREVPEPGFYGLLFLGLGGLYTAVTRRRKSTSDSTEQ